MLYIYKALDNNAIKKGEIDAGSLNEVTEYLKSNGLFPIEIKAKKSTDVTFLSKYFDKVSQNDITYMTRQFAIMLNAGLTLINSIEIIAKQTKKPPFKKMLDEIDKNLRDGKTFSQALEMYPDYFSNFFVALIKSGEASGKLDMILSKLAEHMEKQREFRSKVKNALIYPTVIVSAMFGMIFVMFAFVMPQLLKLYENFQVELPQSTKIIMAISTFTSSYWLMIIIVVAAIVIGIQKFAGTERGKKLKDTMMLKVPVIGTVVQTAALVDVTRTLSILISSGVPILDGLAIVTNVNDNTVFKLAFGRIMQKVEKGFGIGTAMANEPVFPPSLIQMTIVGEQTGHLDETLLRISEYYQSESESAIKAMLALIEPAILVVLGLVVGTVVFGVLSPIFSLTSSIQ